MKTPSPPAPALDHLIHLFPNLAALEESISLYSSLGFLVFRGGHHADLLTTNALIVLPDGVYIELIAFLDYEDVPRDGETKDEWQKCRDAHWWIHKKPGWIDWCLAGGISDGRIEDINSSSSSSPVYRPSREGGRTTLRGEHVRWKVTFPVEELSRYALPFWCEDLTPREIRVPPLPQTTEQSSSSPHPNGVQGVLSLLFLFEEESYEEVVKAWDLVFPRPMGSSSKGDEVTGVTYLLTSPLSPSRPIQVKVQKASDPSQRDWLASHRSSSQGSSTSLSPSEGGLYEVEIDLPAQKLPESAPPDGIERTTDQAGYGRIRFHPIPHHH